MNMTPNDSARLLERLTTEFPTGEAALTKLESELSATVTSAEEFGKRQNVPLAWTALWEQRWKASAEYLQRIQLLLWEMSHYTEGTTSDLLQAAMAAWEELQAEDVQLTTSLHAIQLQTASLTAAERSSWNQILQSAAPQFARLHTYATVLRIRLELLRANSREGVDSLVRHLLVTLPGHSPSQEPDQELLRQWNLPYENKAEHKTLQSGGFMELLKVLLMWQDEPVYQKPPTLTVTNKEVARPAALAM